MPPTSAGLLLYRLSPHPQFLLVHPGGPYFRNKDLASWSIPKGLVNPAEPLLTAALREFTEELSLPLPPGPYHALTPIRQKSGKIVHAFAAQADLDLTHFKSNTFSLQYPPRSNKWIQIPEIDQAEYFDLPITKQKILPAQLPLITELLTLLAHQTHP